MTAASTTSPEAVFDSVRSLERSLEGAPQIVVLFSDLVGSTAYKQSRGIVAGIRRSYQHNRIVIDAIERFKGKFVKSLGDGVMARFDGPAAAYQAVRVATEIQWSLQKYNEQFAEGGDKLLSRIGISRGRAIDMYGEDPHGPCVDLAARLEARAKPGQILVSKTVIQGVRIYRDRHQRGNDEFLRQFEQFVSPLVEVSLKGFVEKQEVHEILVNGVALGVELDPPESEKWSQYYFSTSLFPCEDDRYSALFFGIDFNLRYRGRIGDNVLRFAVVDNLDDLRRSLNDERIFSSYLLPALRRTETPDDSLYTVKRVTINGTDIEAAPTKLIRTDTGRQYVTEFSAPFLGDVAKDIVDVHYQVKTIIRKAGNFYYTVFEHDTSDAIVAFDVGAVKSEIKSVRAVDFLGTRKPPKIYEKPDSDSPHRIELHMDECVPERSGIVFVWSLR
ncbi:MAG: adenylate/guanylate cyclase domain-containing protein [Rhizobiaceae bacterium]|nr:adenylate/guanylate cyclase domain-containing protein [Rhizobiaceae bacterium]